jgi:beta-glucanase (GH16 family)
MTQNALNLTPIMLIPFVLGCGAGNKTVREIQGNSPMVTIATTASDWSPASDLSVIWSDEFNGDLIDTSTWGYDTETTGWCKAWNKELQNYVDDGTGGANAYIKDGNLVIKALKIAPNTYTSARITTLGKYYWQNNIVVAARMKLPYGQGIWPAFWMLPETGSWPNSGEIDIMELIGGGTERDNKTYGTIHGPGYSGACGIQGSTILASGNFSDTYHVFAMQWTAGQMSWYVDGIQYHTVRKDTVPGNWPFDNQKFHILFNLAVGGNWPGNPDETTVFPQEMLIDWVRVYQ